MCSCSGVSASQVEDNQWCYLGPVCLMVNEIIGFLSNVFHQRDYKWRFKCEIHAIGDKRISPLGLLIVHLSKLTPRKEMVPSRSPLRNDLRYMIFLLSSWKYFSMHDSSLCDSNYFLLPVFLKIFTTNIGFKSLRAMNHLLQSGTHSWSNYGYVSQLSSKSPNGDLSRRRKKKY